MKIGGRANIGDVVIRVEVAVQGDAQEFDAMNKVNYGIRYPGGTESAKVLSQADVQMHMSSVLSVLAKS